VNKRWVVDKRRRWRQMGGVIWWRRLADKWRDATAEWHWWLRLRGQRLWTRGAQWWQMKRMRGAWVAVVREIQ
jgi:hypothetical protein